MSTTAELYQIADELRAMPAMGLKFATDHEVIIHHSDTEDTEKFTIFTPMGAGGLRFTLRVI